MGSTTWPGRGRGFITALLDPSRPRDASVSVPFERKPHDRGMRDGSHGGKAGLMLMTGIKNLPKPLARAQDQGPAHGSAAGLTQHPALSLVLRS
jgi:hypothetical protein